MGMFVSVPSLITGGVGGRAARRLSKQGILWLTAGLLGTALWVGAALTFGQSDGRQQVDCGALTAHVWRDPVTGRLKPEGQITSDAAGHPACNSAAAAEGSSAP
ncbi:hypothetical protein ACFQU1_10935 [Chelatococcus sp. GCM10030263]|uniref:hypothetical protein n=1 Tax=Chelatococcus sp. GCM10030263 TaxID=3273387 RepID=UPI003623F40B